LDGDHDDPFLTFDVDIDQEHPAPRPEHEPKAIPSAGQGRTETRESLESTQDTRDAGAGVSRQAVRSNKSVEVFDGSPRQLDASHRYSASKLMVSPA
jgi:hypothetical protein